ncbi:MAG: DUF4439 domain-containing protein [Jatrophihabitans sp.]
MTTPVGGSGSPAPSSVPGSRSDSANTFAAAWQVALAAEHQAAFGYGLIGPRLTGSDRQLARTCSADHDTIRTSIASAMAAAGMTPVAPEADYPALYPVQDTAAARRVAVRLENACAAGWRFLYAQCVASAAAPARTLRSDAQRQLTAAAVRGSRWRAVIDPAKATTAFPGID